MNVGVIGCGRRIEQRGIGVFLTCIMHKAIDHLDNKINNGDKTMLSKISLYHFIIPFSHG